MYKKIFAGIFFAYALLTLIGSIPNGLSGAILFGIIIFALSGIFMLTFDSAHKLDYVSGFKKRGKQNVLIIIFMVIYFLFMLIVSIGVSLATMNIIYCLFATLIFFIPFMAFLVLYGMEFLPYSESKKYFLRTKDDLNKYIGNVGDFAPLTEDKSVLVSDKGIFFPGIFCFVLFDEIKEIKLVKQLWEQDVYFYLNNGKKFYVVSKHFDAISKAVNDRAVSEL